MIRSLVPLALCVPALVAQTPAPATLGQQLAAEGPVIEKLLTEKQPREAFAKAQALVPAEIPPFDKSNLNNARRSYIRNREIIRALDTAGRTAYAAGYWEKALEYFTKAAQLAKTNNEETKAVETPQLNYWQEKATKSKKLMDDNAAWIKELRAKTNPDESDRFNLEQIDSIEKEFAESDKWATFFQKDIEVTEKDLAYYGPKPEEVDKGIKAEEEQLATYKFKNDKVKFVEGVMASKNYFDAYTENQKIQALYRLNVLSPDNKAVLRAIEVLQGKAAPEPKAKPTPKKKG